MKMCFVIQCKMPIKMFIDNLDDNDVIYNIIRNEQLKTIIRCEGYSEITFKIPDEAMRTALLDIISDSLESAMGMVDYDSGNWKVSDSIEKMKITSITIQDGIVNFKITFDANFRSYEAALIEKLTGNFNGEIEEIYTERKTV